MDDKLTPEQASIMEAFVQAFVHVGKEHGSLEEAIENMPEEFWTRLDIPHRDKVERLLKEHFRSES